VRNFRVDFEPELKESEKSSSFKVFYYRSNTLEADVRKRIA
jgi:hypothetical protein